ncbi:putative integrase recombinase protein [Burkholderia phage Bp-AMP4]|uniref:Integrase n=1 Tax=Burkholderia phage Bp-AMP4 TaxID=1437329 RepID=A0A0A8KXK4_9CAUD|nr:putative integrase recombinase protein [Burkholderia phage Bp-AMP4]
MPCSDTKYAQYRLVNFTKDVVAKWRDERLEKVSGSTVNREMNLLGHVIEKARKEWGVELPENPVQEVERPKHSPHRERRLRDDEEARLLFAAEKARNKYLRPLIVLALETAMRRAELVNLQWEFIDIPKRRIHLIEGGGVNGDFSIKNGSSRVVPLSKRAIDALEAYQPDPAKRKGQVFEELTEEAVTQAFTRTVARAKMENFHLHDLRHEATSRFFEKGLSIAEVKSITGHKSMSALERYVHINAGGLAAKLD